MDRKSCARASRPWASAKKANRAGHARSAAAGSYLVRPWYLATASKNSARLTTPSPPVSTSRSSARRPRGRSSTPKATNPFASSVRSKKPDPSSSNLMKISRMPVFCEMVKSSTASQAKPSSFCTSYISRIKADRNSSSEMAPSALLSRPFWNARIWRAVMSTPLSLRPMRSSSRSSAPELSSSIALKSRRSAASCPPSSWVSLSRHRSQASSRARGLGGLSDW
mmetsp:Transcript_55803/g.126829  ORF Transcript_55803/g.126829 Transcript_55803/m.126829 type:complete len:224 (-) Transcript_55803:1264-1935(-)